MAEEDNKTNIPECCKECMKWDQFGEKCWVFWHGKSQCSQMVNSQDEWDYEKLVLKK